MRAFALLACICVLAGCTHEPLSRGLPVQNQKWGSEPKIQFLGVGGWLIHWRGEGVLLAPSFSNPASFGLLGIPPAHVIANNERIDRLMPPADDVTMLLVGHAHYDHLLDVPRIREKHTPHATVYGSETVKHILAAAKTADGQTIFPPGSVVVPAMDQIADHRRPDLPGTWFYSGGGTLKDGDRHSPIPPGTIRAMPITSMHAGHMFRHNFIEGEYCCKDLDELPTGILDWKLGQVTISWLIDLLGEDGKPVYRLFYQDSAAEPTFGYPPLIADSKRTDVVILCGGGWNQVDYYPAGILRLLQPRIVVLGHWENFFGNDPDSPARTIPLLNYDGLLEQLKPYNFVVPEPMSDVLLPPPLVSD